jgi:hypothetical protein
LHGYENYTEWISIGVQPKQKDLKSFMEDIYNKDYLTRMSDYQSSLVIEGKKVRIGFTGSKLDPFCEG